MLLIFFNVHIRLIWPSLLYFLRAFKSFVHGYHYITHYKMSCRAGSTFVKSHTLGATPSGGANSLPLLPCMMAFMK